MRAADANCFQLGLARLRLPQSKADGFFIWDIPCPPLESRWSSLLSITQPCHIRTIQLEGCTGFTFFMLSGYTYAVHAHTSSRLSARGTFNALPIALQKAFFWLHVPIIGSLKMFGFSSAQQVYGDRRQSFLVRRELQ